MDIARIAILGVVGVLIEIQFKGVRQEYSAYIGLGVSLLIFFYACEYLGRMKDSVMALGSVLEEGGYLGILFKIIGITYLSEFCAVQGCRISVHRFAGGTVWKGDDPPCWDAGGSFAGGYDHSIYGMKEERWNRADTMEN